jgi:hypothetical protein
MKFRFLLPLLLILTVFIPIPVNAALPTLGTYEVYNTGGADNVSVYGAIWMSQGITTSATTAHSVSIIKLPLKRVGLPGYVTCSLRETLTGVDLFSYTLDGDTLSTTDYEWVSFVSSTRYDMKANTAYSIVLRAPTATGATYIVWAATAAGGVAGGNEFSSVNSGSTWVDNAPIDLEYEVWGYPSLNIIGVNVFKDYLETGDWVVMISADCTLAPYYAENADPGAYIVVQLRNNAGIVVASTPFKYWDRQPIALYMSAAGVVGQTWAGVYTVRIADVSGAPYATYSILGTDWKGSDKSKIDTWLRLQATDYQSYYSTTLLVATGTQGLVLNDTGKVIFVRGIPQIDTVRPLMFQTSSSTDTKLNPEAYTRTYELGRDYTTELGPTLTNMLEQFTLVTTGNVTTNNVKSVGTYTLVILYLILALSLASTGGIGTWAGIALGIPVMLTGAYFGIVNLSAIAVIGSIMALIVIYQVMWGKA